MTRAPVVVLAGGTGGAKLARGMLDVAGDDLVVVANTGDDVELHGAYVSPDPDLCAFWLADRIDARGWGLEGDTFAVMDGLRELGGDVWFNLGDRDLAYGLRRAERLREGARLTEAHAEITTALGITARVLPMSDAPVRTEVQTGGTWVNLQRFLILHRGAPVEGVRMRGASSTRPSPEVLTAIAGARAIVVGPSNPVISIGPILALDGMRDALGAADAPVVAVSPIVGGTVLKGPTADFLSHAGHAVNAAGVAALYDGLLDGIVTDEPWAGAIPALRCDTMLGDPASRRRVADATLRFAESL
jgi:LPPG:FO 2-phospho-L-lactate transferase